MNLSNIKANFKIWIMVNLYLIINVEMTLFIIEKSNYTEIYKLLSVKNILTPKIKKKLFSKTN
jgi:hypothetical protein